MQTFKKEERLCNKRLIDELFHNGSSFLCYPFKASWLVVDGPQTVPVQVLFAVAKKRYKRAVDRNMLKLLMREEYRLHKQELLYDFLAQADKSIILSISYIGKEINEYKLIEKKMLKLFTQLCEGLAK